MAGLLASKLMHMAAKLVPYTDWTRDLTVLSEVLDSMWRAKKNDRRLVFLFLQAQSPNLICWIKNRRKRKQIASIFVT